LGFQVQSEGKTPIHNYTILNISYDNYAIIPRDTDMLHGNGCPRDSHNVSFGSELLSYTNSFDSLKFFFDCYSKPGDDLPPDFQNCQIKLQRVKHFNSNPPAGSSAGVSFVLSSGEGNVSREYQLAYHCRQLVTLLTTAGSADWKWSAHFAEVVLLCRA
jgi:hypothetical protein